jgi:predicted PurR-regulated permease PerM
MRVQEKPFTASLDALLPPLRRRVPSREIWKVTGIAAAVIAGIWFVAHTIDVLLVLFAAIVFAEAIRPLVHLGMERLRLPRWSATVIVYLALFTIVGFMVYIVVTPLADQIQNLAQHFPDRLTSLQQQFAALQKTPTGQAITTVLGPQAVAIGTAIGAAVLGIPSAAFGVLFNVAFTLFLAFYWLNSTDGLRSFFVSLFPDNAHKLMHDICNEIGLQLGAYARSVVINMLAIGTITSVALWVLRIPDPLVLGVFAALTEAVPLVGPYIGAIPAVILGLSVSPLSAILVIATYVIIQQIESNWLVPLVIGRTVGINPMVTLLAVLVGASLYSIPGALLAVPVVVILQSVFLRVIVPALRGEFHLDAPDDDARVEVERRAGKATP